MRWKWTMTTYPHQVPLCQLVMLLLCPHSEVAWIPMKFPVHSQVLHLIGAGARLHTHRRMKSRVLLVSGVPPAALVQSISTALQGLDRSCAVEFLKPLLDSLRDAPLNDDEGAIKRPSEPHEVGKKPTSSGEAVMLVIIPPMYVSTPNSIHPCLIVHAGTIPPIPMKNGYFTYKKGAIEMCHRGWSPPFQ